MKKERKRLYEGMYILNATLSEDARKKALKKITDSIEQHGGEIKKIHEQGRRRLAYSIDKKREGFYYVMYFLINSNHIKELWNDYHLHEDLIRFITLHADTVLETIEFKPINMG